MIPKELQADVWVWDRVAREWSRVFLGEIAVFFFPLNEDNFSDTDIPLWRQDQSPEDSRSPNPRQW